MSKTVKIYCHQFSKNGKTVTIVRVGEKTYDQYHNEYEKLNKDGWRYCIELSGDIPDFVGDELKPGVFLIDGKMSPSKYINENTSYDFVFERMKDPQESIGSGRLPGSVGRFQKKIT
jgi:hypothetical protein